MLTISEQDRIQWVVAHATPDERVKMVDYAYPKLVHYAMDSHCRKLSKTESKHIEYLIELLVRLEGLEKGAGSFWRAAKRLSYGKRFYGLGNPSNM